MHVLPQSGAEIAPLWGTKAEPELHFGRGAPEKVAETAGFLMQLPRISNHAHAHALPPSKGAQNERCGQVSDEAKVAHNERCGPVSDEAKGRQNVPQFPMKA
jgi:hypothetical protein